MDITRNKEKSFHTDKVVNSAKGHNNPKLSNT